MPCIHYVTIKMREWISDLMCAFLWVKLSFKVYSQNHCIESIQHGWYQDYLSNMLLKIPSNHITLNSSAIKTSTVSEMKIIVKCNFYRFLFSLLIITLINDLFTAFWITVLNILSIIRLFFFQNLFFRIKTHSLYIGIHSTNINFLHEKVHMSIIHYNIHDKVVINYDKIIFYLTNKLINGCISFSHHTEKQLYIYSLYI